MFTCVGTCLALGCRFTGDNPGSCNHFGSTGRNDSQKRAWSNTNPIISTYPPFYHTSSGSCSFQLTNHFFYVLPSHMLSIICIQDSLHTSNVHGASICQHKVEVLLLVSWVWHLHITSRVCVSLINLEFKITVYWDDTIMDTVAYGCQKHELEFLYRREASRSFHPTTSNEWVYSMVKLKQRINTR